MDAPGVSDMLTRSAPADTLGAVTPAPNTLSIAALAVRYEVSKPAVEKWLEGVREAWEQDPSLPEPPEWSRVEGTKLLHVHTLEWDAFERARRDAGLPMPGDRRGQRGPDRQPRSGGRWPEGGRP